MCLSCAIVDADPGPPGPRGDPGQPGDHGEVIFPCYSSLGVYRLVTFGNNNRWENY